jgi:hypothetical protein
MVYDLTSMTATHLGLIETSNHKHAHGSIFSLVVPMHVLTFGINVLAIATATGASRHHCRALGFGRRINHRIWPLSLRAAATISFMRGT